MPKFFSEVRIATPAMEEVPPTALLPKSYEWGGVFYINLKKEIDAIIAGNHDFNFQILTSNGYEKNLEHGMSNTPAFNPNIKKLFLDLYSKIRDSRSTDLRLQKASTVLIDHFMPNPLSSGITIGLRKGPR